MRWILFVTLIAISALPSLGQGWSTSLQRVGPDELLAFVQRLSLPAEEKSIWLAVLPGALERELVDPTVAYTFFQRLASTPAYFVSELTAVMREVLAQGLPIDDLMNKASQGIVMGRSWDLIIEEIRLRGAILIATGSALAPHRPPAEARTKASVRIGGWSLTMRTPTWEDLVVEVAEAISDYIVGGGDINNWGAIEAFVRYRLSQLKGRGLPTDLVERALGVLNSQFVGDIVSRAFMIERR